MAEDSRSLFVCAGEMSGDQHAARVVAALRRKAPDLRVWGVGGPALEAQGVELLHNCQEFSVLGVVEVLRFLPRLAQIRGEVLEEIGKRRPSAVLLVDFGGFNIGLGQALRKRHPDLPVVYFISPQVWGSRPWRADVIARTMTKMLVIFPFEEPLYKNKGMPARFVGHPLAQELERRHDRVSREDFMAGWQLDPARPLIGVFPGSRRQEIEDLGPVVLTAIEWLLAERPQLQFAMSQASDRLAGALDALLGRRKFRHLVGNGLTLIPPGENRPLMSASDLVWAKSGTTTLEAALMGKPMLIYYRGNWLSYFLFMLFKRVQHAGWPNILAGRQVVPELFQLDCRPEQLVRYTRDWLDVPGFRAELSNILKAVRTHLGQGDFAENAAAELMEILGIHGGQAADSPGGSGRAPEEEEMQQSGGRDR
jgi:lipid-A-disaccharide synthase